jgi:cytochrome c oxidase subunit 2
MPIWSILTNQNRNSPLIENLSSFNDHIIVILILVLLTTGLFGILTISQKNFSRIIRETQEIEIFWSTLPTIILIMIAIPSLKLLYLLEEPINSSLSIKIIGHQWYWSYEYSDLKEIRFDSFITKEIPRNLITRNFLIIPSITSTRLLMTSSDVIHSWTIPSIGVKIDAIPGRINQFYSIISRVGVFSGQCSEICGIKHRFIPINISSLPIEKFIKSIKELFFSSKRCVGFLNQIWVNNS